jgi:cell division protein FtsB
MRYEEFHIEAPQPEKHVDRALRGLVRLGKFCLLLLVVPVVVAVYRHPLAEQKAQRAKLEAMQTERDALEARRDRLFREVEWIKGDTTYLEMRARDHVHMHKKGEYVIRFEQ